MKLPEIRPMRSMCLETIFLKRDPKSRRGLNPFHSKLDDITGATNHDARNFDYDLRTKKIEVVTNKRITFARTKGKNRFHAVGMGEFSGSFDGFKDAMKSAGFTGYRMFGKENALN